MRTLVDKTLILNEIKSHYKFDSNAEFARFLGIAPNTLSNWYSRNTIDYELIISKCEEISGDWLLTHHGSMLRGKAGNEQNHMNGSGSDPNLQFLKKHKLIPLIPINAMAGYAAGDIQIMDNECEQFIIPTLSEADFLIRVKGRSMEPHYDSGDVVACLRIPLDTFFQWGKVYVLDTIQGPLIKRIHKGIDDDHVLVVSDNLRFGEFQLHRNSIRALALVIGGVWLE